VVSALLYYKTGLTLYFPFEFAHKGMALQKEKRANIKRLIGDVEEIDEVEVDVDGDGGKKEKMRKKASLAGALLFASLPPALTLHQRMRLFDASSRDNERLAELFPGLVLLPFLRSNVNLLGGEHAVEQLNALDRAGYRAMLIDVANGKLSVEEASAKIEPRLILPPTQAIIGATILLYQQYLGLQKLTDVFHQLKLDDSIRPSGTNSHRARFMNEMAETCEKASNVVGELLMRRAEEGYILTSILVKRSGDDAKQAYQNPSADLANMQKQMKAMSMSLHAAEAGVDMDKMKLPSADEFRRIIALGLAHHDFKLLPMHLFIAIMRYGGDANEARAVIEACRQRSNELEKMMVETQHVAHINAYAPMHTHGKQQHAHDSTGRHGIGASTRPASVDQNSDVVSDDTLSTGLQRMRKSIDCMERALPHVKQKQQQQRGQY